MEIQKDMAIGVLRRRRAHLRRMVRAHCVLDHDLMDMHRVVRVYLQVGVLIRRSVSRVGRVEGVTFNVNVFSAQESLSTFRFLPSDVGRLAADFHLDAAFPVRRYRVDATECLAIVLQRLASPARWADLEVLFGCCRFSLSDSFCLTADRLMTKWGHLLTRCRGDFMAERAAVYAGAVRRRGAPLLTSVGFIDGTAIHVARPGGGLQRACYSRHKRRHVLKFQSVTTPDVLVFHMYGPHEGRRHDMVLYYESGLNDHWRQTLLIDGVQHHLYGDSACVLCALMQTGHGNRPDRTAAELAFDLSMSRVRKMVECGYKDIKQYFTTLDFQRKLKTRDTAVGKQYLSGALRCNIRSCRYGDQTASYFGCDPPSFERYLSD